MKFFRVLTVLALLMGCLLFSGCVFNRFETVYPPDNTFPLAAEYETAEVISGDFIVKKGFNGNLYESSLYLQSDVETTSGFFVGQKGFVTYTYSGMEITVPAEITQCPTQGAGVFRASHEDVGLKEAFPGKFWFVEYEAKNSLMVDAHAVLLLDNDGSALVKTVDNKGILHDIPITVDRSNGEYYRIVSGLSEADKVVIL